MLVLVCGLGLLTSGCAIPGLKEANQRLKEQNDRLVSENNRLEQELVARNSSSIPDLPGEESTPDGGDAADLLIPGENGIGPNVQIERTPEGNQDDDSPSCFLCPRTHGAFRHRQGSSQENWRGPQWR